ncbi:SH3 domain-binding glutamic acid-rich-like protein 3 [Heptranchias perlo]|uniref:SH3 domain-binding glutamic acid-rich-like protein 3 n=1 Tax=Heptranchias perlo TaxID=212740 RepID=UPI00355951D6
MGITVYYCSITTTIGLDKNQREIINTLNGMQIPYKLLDLSADASLKDEMRAKVGDPKAMAPQIFNGDQYCGDYDAFFQAMEAKKIQQFFKVDNLQNKLTKE